MKLSQAILLGDTLRERNPGLWYNPDGCGCALGGAMLAVGHSQHRWVFSADIKERWPWVAPYITCISSKFHDVCDGLLTIEQLADYVRSIEPPETCSECRSEQPVNEIQVCQECLSNK